MRNTMLVRVLAAPLCLAISTLAHAAGCAAGATGVAPHLAVHHYYYDPVLKHTWAVVIDCRHPEWPAKLQVAAELGFSPAGSEARTSGTGVQTAGIGARTAAFDLQGQPPSMPATSAGGQPGLWLLAGAPVRLWKEGPVRIDLSAIAVESAPLGAAVRVRAGDPGVLLRGIVRGAHSVELVAEGLAWQQ